LKKWYRDIGSREGATLEEEYDAPVAYTARRWEDEVGPSCLKQSGERSKKKNKTQERKKKRRGGKEMAIRRVEYRGKRGEINL